MAAGREAMIRIILSVLLSQTGPARTRAVAVAFAREGLGRGRDTVGAFSQR